MTQTKKRLLVIVALVMGLIFYQPFTVRAEDQVSTAMTFDDDAVFYLADESMSTIYKCTISGFYESSPVEDAATGSWVVKKGDLTYKVELITTGTPSFSMPTIADINTYSSSIQAHKTEWYRTSDEKLLYTEEHPEFLTNGNDNGQVYKGISVSFKNFYLAKDGYHIEEESVDAYSYAVFSANGTKTPAYAYNHLYSADSTWSPYVTDKSQCLKLKYQTNFKNTIDCFARIWTEKGEDEIPDLQRLGSSSSFDSANGTMTLNGELFYFGGLRWVDCISGKMAMESDVPIYVFTPVANNYKVRFKTGGGYGSIPDMTMTYDVAAALTKNNGQIYRPGYIFTGEWMGTWKDADGVTHTATFTDGQTVKNITNVDGGVVTMTANWEPDPSYNYQIIYDGNGATSGSMDATEAKKDEAVTLSANKFKRKFTVNYDAASGTFTDGSTAMTQSVASTFEGWMDHNPIIYNGISWEWWTFDAPYYANKYSDIKAACGYNKYLLAKNYFDYVIYGNATINGSEVFNIGQYKTLNPSLNETYSGSKPGMANHWDAWGYVAGLQGKNTDETDTKDSAGKYLNVYPNQATVANLTYEQTHAVTLSARWTDKEVTLPTASDVSRTGYTLLGWSTVEGAETAEYAPGETVLVSENLTFYAVWEPVKVKVTFHKNDGSTTTTTRTYTYDVTGQQLIDPGWTRTGYTEAGWALSSDATSKDYKLTASVNNKWIVNNSPEIDLYMVWEPITIDVTFHKNDGSTTTTEKTYTYDVTGQQLIDPGWTRTGYTEVGWALSSDATSKDYKLTASINNKWIANNSPEIDLYMVWEPITIDVTFHKNDGSTTTTEKTYTYDVTGQKFVDPGWSRTGYEAKGWAFSSDATSKKYSITSNVSNSWIATYAPAVDLYMVWNPITYTIDYDLAGGALPDGVTNPSTYTVNTETFTLNNPEREGYTFLGWTGSNGDTPQTTVTVKKGSTGDKSYTANWKADEDTTTYTLTLKKGTGIKSVSGAGTYKAGETVTIKAVATTGYQFKNWTGYAAYTTASYSFTMPAENVTLTANATAITYTIDYDLDGGALPDGKTNPSTYTVSTATFTLNNPERDGYIFLGWTGSNGDNPETAVTIEKGSTGNRSYKANWKEKEYTLTLAKGKGIDTVTGDGTYKAGDRVTIEATVLEGYEFKDWTGYAAYTTAKYTLTMPAESITLTASASLITYTIAYDLDGGALPDGKTNPESFTIETPDFTLNNPEREGFTFLGWTGSNGSTPEVTVTIAKGSTGNRSYKANWSANDYTVTLDKGKGIESVTGAGTYKAGDSVTIGAVAAFGYEFQNWTGYATSTSAYYTFVMPAKDVTFMASTCPITYHIDYDLNGGTLPDDETNPESFTIETPGFDLINPEKEGYEFIGWTGSNGDTPELTVTIDTGSTGDRRYIANWEPIKYIIHFDGNGATDGQMPDQEVTYDVETPLTSNGFIRENEFGGSLFKGWNIITDTQDVLYEDGAVIKNLTNKQGTVITLYAVWDDCPGIEAEDLYYTLEQAQSGYITLDELMGHATASDREDGSPIPPGENDVLGTYFTIIDYQPSDFTQFQHDGSVSETYKVIDSAGNSYKKMIVVHIVDTTPVVEVAEGYTRFINEKYYNASYENGGLEDNSIWKTDPEYVAALQTAFDNLRNGTPVRSYTFSHETILEMKEFITQHGIGNSKEPDALQKFYDQFMATST